MNWLKKLQENNIEEKKVSKKIASKIDEYKEIDAQIKELEAERDGIAEEDMQEFENDVAELKTDLKNLDKNICSMIDKYVADLPALAERAKKMQEGRKAAQTAKAATAIEPEPQPELEPQPAPEPQPEKKKSGIGGFILGAALILITGGIAAKYLKK